eukprot:scaffold603_cov404-Prasinococcus_capsulatus_cf.AAC.21
MSVATCATVSGAEDATQILQDMDLSKKEVDKLSKAFRDPEFKKLFQEYAEELQDPKHREENEAYLRQLEAEGGIQKTNGVQMELLAPQAAFVIKTQDKKTSQPVYVNVCTSAKVDLGQRKKVEGTPQVAQAAYVMAQGGVVMHTQS